MKQFRQKIKSVLGHVFNHDNSHRIDHHSVLDTEGDTMILDVKNQIFVEGEKLRVGKKVFQILEIISPVIRLRVKEIKENGD